MMSIKITNRVNDEKQHWWSPTSSGKQDLTVVIQRSNHLVATGQIPHTPQTSFTTLRDVVKRLVLVGKRCRLGGETLKHT